MRLSQPRPGVLQWNLPNGRTYVVSSDGVASEQVADRPSLDWLDQAELSPDQFKLVLAS